MELEFAYRFCVVEEEADDDGLVGIGVGESAAARYEAVETNGSALLRLALVYQKLLLVFYYVEIPFDLKFAKTEAA